MFLNVDVLTSLMWLYFVVHIKLQVGDLIWRSVSYIRLALSLSPIPLQEYLTSIYLQLYR